MDNESVSGDPQNSAPSNGGVSRRSLMKAGTHAAWAIPMVQVVAAAPAIAASGAALTVTVLSGTSTVKGNVRSTDIHFTVAASAFTPPYAIVVKIVFTAIGVKGNVTAPTGWSTSTGGSTGGVGTTFQRTLTPDGTAAAQSWDVPAVQFSGDKGDGKTSTTFSGTITAESVDKVPNIRTISNFANFSF